MCNVCMCFIIFFVFFKGRDDNDDLMLNESESSACFIMNGNTNDLYGGETLVGF